MDIDKINELKAHVLNSIGALTGYLSSIGVTVDSTPIVQAMDRQTLPVKYAELTAKFKEGIYHVENIVAEVNGSAIDYYTRISPSHVVQSVSLLDIPSEFRDNAKRLHEKMCKTLDVRIAFEGDYVISHDEPINYDIEPPMNHGVPSHMMTHAQPVSEMDEMAMLNAAKGLTSSIPLRGEDYSDRGKVATITPVDDVMMNNPEAQATINKKKQYNQNINFDGDYTALP